MANKPKTSNKGTALITGASAGIGAALARCFASNGHDVILVARSENKLNTLAAEFAKEHGITASVIAQDLGKSDGAQLLVEQLHEQGMSVDILVNNAGLLSKGPFVEADWLAHQQLLQVNIGALVGLTHALLPEMISRGSGRVMNIASTSAFQPVPNLTNYAASKAYVLSFSEALSIELKDSGVTCTALCPGFTETDMIAADSDKSGKPMSLPFVKNMTAEQVAKEGYEACMAGKPLYVNGLANQLVVSAGRLQPRWLMRRSAEVVAKNSF